ncbi:3-hydroxyisobutyrate dehydrogenase [Sphingomonas palmae]|uniref:3-hydroxyisobutyrate dehydrogenase n=1 Tax=Sphingomonas palmae TaxID=1855283 RepID=A0A1H7R406_9SPHN|nr:NAD(P)-dependent oxidoreductase [Sphingomonas palmae]SEL54980.1 3-hydroxyisobutyrate dehydrogenase [Sphingomonas palmae]
MDIGFVGLGRMGIGMACNLAAAGHYVRAWNRSPVDKAELPGVELLEQAADAFESEVVFTMLADDAAIRQVVLDAGLLERARPGLIHVVSATIAVDFARELAAAHEAAGLGYVSAPVFGRPDAAAAAKLNVVAAGKRDAVARVRPLLDVIGQRTFVLGEEPHQANAAKVAGNMLIAMTIEALGEAMTLTEAHGLSRADFLEIATGTLFGCPAYHTYGGKIVAEDYKPGFVMKLGLKDLRLATAAGEAAGRTLPMLDAVRGQMERAIDAGMAARDWSAVADYTINGER